MSKLAILFYVLTLATFPVVAEESYHCVGKYNTGVGYDHVYTVKKDIVGNEVLFWLSQKFEIHPDMRSYLLYATYVGNTGVDVIYIDIDTLRVEFSSIRYGTPLLASGKCRKIK